MSLNQSDTMTASFHEENQQVTLHGIFNQPYTSTITNVKSILVYTDYENVQVKYSCIELKSFWYTDIEENVAVLTRSPPNQIDTNLILDTLYDKLKSLPFDLNKLEYLKSNTFNQSCQNVNRQYINYRLPNNLMVSFCFVLLQTFHNLSVFFNHYFVSVYGKIF